MRHRTTVQEIRLRHLHCLQNQTSEWRGHCYSVEYFAIFKSHLRYGIAAWGLGSTASTSLEQVLIHRKQLDA